MTAVSAAPLSRRRPLDAPRPAKRRIHGVGERVIEGLLLFAACSSVLVTVGIIYVLVSEAAGFFKEVSLREFLFTTEWTPLFANPKFGILPLVAGTVVTTAVALSIALPVGSILAIYLSEFAPHLVREVVKPLLELLNAVPTVVYGYFALLWVAPFLQKLITDLPLFSMLSAGLVMGVMIVPYVTSLSEDALRSVPMNLREGSYALGGSKLWTALRVVYPAALSGVGAAYILAVSRAIGETMVVAIAAGMQPNFTWNPKEPAETITAYIVQVSLGDLPHGSIGYQSIFAAGLVLFAMTLAFNVAGHLLRTRLRQAY